MRVGQWRRTGAGAASMERNQPGKCETAFVPFSQLPVAERERRLAASRARRDDIRAIHADDASIVQRRAAERLFKPQHLDEG